MSRALAALPLPARRLLTVDQAAAYCGVSAATLRTHIKVSPVKIGNSVRYDIHALDRWLDSRSHSEPMTGDDWLERLDEGEGARN